MQNAESWVVISNIIQLIMAYPCWIGGLIPSSISGGENFVFQIYAGGRVPSGAAMSALEGWGEVKLVAMLAGIYLLVSSNMAGKSSRNTVWMAKSEDFLSEFPLPCFEKTGYLTNDYCESHVVLHSSGINPVQSTAAPVCIARGGMLDAAQQLLSQRAESSCHLAVGDERVCVLSQGGMQ